MTGYYRPSDRLQTTQTSGCSVKSAPVYPCHLPYMSIAEGNTQFKHKTQMKHANEIRSLKKREACPRYHGLYNCVLKENNQFIILSLLA